MKTQRNHCACVPTIMWKARELNQFCSAFFPRRQKRQKNEGRAPLQKRHGLFGEMGAWCEQTMINTVPSSQTPIFLDVILGADNRPALYRSHTCAWVRNRAGWEGAAVVFSQCVWVAMIHKHRGFVLSSSHLPHSAVGGAHSQARWE